MSESLSSGGGRGKNPVWTVLDMIEWATGYFNEKGIANPRLSIEWLLSDLLGIKRLDLYLQFDRPLTDAQLDTLRGWVLRRGKHEPLQYITGSTDFYHCTIRVDRRVLIPRPETEELVDLILSEHPPGRKTVVDLGTGSGCIAVALKKARPDWHVIGLDIDASALALARENAEANSVAVEWIHGDLTQAGALLPGGRIDIVVSNPPYILPGEASSLDAEVRDYEPGMALFHEDPLKLYRAILALAFEQHPPAAVYCEIHSDCGPAWSESLQSPGMEVRIVKDYHGKHRFLLAVPAAGGG